MPRCFTCGSPDRQVKGKYEFSHPKLGDFVLNDADYGWCDKCEKITLIPHDTSIAIDKAIEERRNDMEILKDKQGVMIEVPQGFEIITVKSWFFPINYCAIWMNRKKWWRFWEPTYAYTCVTMTDEDDE